MVKVNDAAAILGISRRQVYRLIERRAVPHIRLGGCVRFERGVLEQWVRDQMLKGFEEKEIVRPAARGPVVGGHLRGGGRRANGAIAPFAWGNRQVTTAG